MKNSAHITLLASCLAIGPVCVLAREPEEIEGPVFDNYLIERMIKNLVIKKFLRFYSFVRQFEKRMRFPLLKNLLRVKVVLTGHQKRFFQTGDSEKVF